MGTIIKIDGADYSNKAVGRYDFERSVYRTKKEDGLFEKYAFYPLFGRVAALPQASWPFGLVLLDGQSEVEFCLDFKYTKRTGQKHIFAVTQNKTTMSIMTNDDEMKIRLSLQSHATGAALVTDIDYVLTSDMMKVGEDGIIGTDYNLRFTLVPNLGGTTAYKFGQIVLNEHANTAPVTTSVASVDNRQGIIAIGKDNIGAPSNINAAGTAPWYIRVRRDGVPVLLFDFIGATETEKLTDKKSGVILVKEGDYSTTPPFLSVR